MDIEFQNQSTCSTSLLTDVQIRRSTFLNGIKSCKVSPNLHEGTGGRSVGYSMEKVIKASFGEHLERLSLFKSRVRPKGTGEQYFDAFHLLNGEVIQVLASEVLLDYHLPIFKHLDQGTMYSDTCGVAAHLNSKDAMLNGFLEFVERQSLIHTWLTERVGERVDLHSIEDERIQETLRHMHKYVEDIQLFNISLSKDVYVILSLGFHEENFGIGIDADTDLVKAMNGSLNEFAMILEGNILADKDAMKDRTFHDSQLYSEIFYQLSGKEFADKFTFLLDAPLMYKKPETNLTFDELIRRVSEEWRVSLYCTFIPNFVESSPEKVIKVFSPDGYPHMNTELFDPEDYSISKTFPSNGFPNRGIHIPFP